jgi:hypothetical protein
MAGDRLFSRTKWTVEINCSKEGPPLLLAAGLRVGSPGSSLCAQSRRWQMGPTVSTVACLAATPPVSASLPKGTWMRTGLLRPDHVLDGRAGAGRLTRGRGSRIQEQQHHEPQLE